MISNVLLVSSLTLVAVVAARRVYALGRARIAASIAFRKASEQFYEAATQLTESTSDIPPEVVHLLEGGGKILASRGEALRFARYLAKGNGVGVRGNRDWSTVLNGLSEGDKSLFIKAISSLVDATVFVSVRYQPYVLRSIYEAAKARPKSKFSITEAKIGAFLIEKRMPEIGRPPCAAT